MPTERVGDGRRSLDPWNYTTVLNIVFLALAAVLVWRFFRTGGREMLRMMGGSPPAEEDAGEHHHTM